MWNEIWCTKIKHIKKLPICFLMSLTKKQSQGLRIVKNHQLVIGVYWQWSKKHENLKPSKHCSNGNLSTLSIIHRFFLQSRTTYGFCIFEIGVTAEEPKLLVTPPVSKGYVATFSTQNHFICVPRFHVVLIGSVHAFARPFATLSPSNELSAGE